MLKYKIRQNSLTGNTITLPFKIDNGISLLGQSDIIQKDFVDSEKIKYINKPIDFEKTMFYPCYINDITQELIVVDSVEYVLNNITWSDSTFETDDFFYVRNNVRYTNLKLDFYDDLNPFKQNNLFDVLLYVDTSINYDINNPISFSRDKTIEGFNLYFYIDMVEDGDYTLYIKPTLQNAKNGESLRLMNVVGPINFGNNYNSDIYMEYKFMKINNKFYYTILGDNITYEDNKLIVNLFKINII